MGKKKGAAQDPLAKLTAESNKGWKYIRQTIGQGAAERADILVAIALAKELAESTAARVAANLDTQTRQVAAALASHSIAVSAEMTRSTSSLASDLHDHKERDARRFDEMAACVASVAADVKSLLHSRTFLYGAWKAIAIVGGIAGFLGGIAVAITKAFHG